MNFLTICRSCLTESSDLKSIFEFCNKIELETRSYNDIIYSLTNLKILACDGLPDKLCSSCIEDMVRSQNFIDKFKKSDSILRGFKIEDKDEIKTENELIINDIEVYHDDFKTSSDEDDESLESRRLKANVNESTSTDEDGDLLVTKDDNNDHQYSKLDKKEKTTNLKCDACGLIYENKTQLTKHRKTHELNLEHAHFCPHPACGKSFSRNTHLKVHMRSHLTDEEKPFGCSECDQHYMFQFQLTQHMFKHSDKKPFPCTVCGKGCLTKLSLKRHMRIHDSDYKQSEHTCEVCEKVFKFPSFLAEHMKNHTGERPFLCSVCGKGFRQRGALQYHVRSHTGFKPFECEVCKNTFVSQGVLKVHMRRHTNERPYVCELCGRAFRQSTDMRSHRRLHYGDKRVQCSVCHKKMSTTGQLTVHMRVHTGEKPFPCSICKKSFATRTMVVKHMRVHSGEKPYSCEICGKSFTQSSSLNTHKKLHYKVNTKNENTDKFIVV